MGRIIAAGRSLQRDGTLQWDDHCNGTIIATGRNIAMGWDTTIR